MDDDSMIGRQEDILFQKLDKIIQLLEEIAAQNRRVKFQMEGDR